MSEEPEARIIRFTCAEHGEIHSADVWCRHDAEAETRAVGAAHRAAYGANCHALMTVDLLDSATGEAVTTERHSYVPPVRAPENTP